MARVIAIAMQKGGVGKTTTTINLAAALGEIGQRVLVVDLDAQGNLTQHCGFDPEEIEPTIYKAFKAEIDGRQGDISDAIYETDESFHLLPSQPELSLIEISLMNVLSREQVLRNLFDPIQAEYDYILIDCNPSLGMLVINALTAADAVIVPVQTEYLAARGANMLFSTIDMIRRKKLNPDLIIEGIVLTMADTRTLLTREILAAVKSQFGDYHIFEQIVKRSVRFGESAVAGKSVVTYDPKSTGAEAYRQIAKELVENGTKATQA